MKQIKKREKIYEISSAELKDAARELLEFDEEISLTGPYFWDSSCRRLIEPGQNPEKIEFITKTNIEITIPAYLLVECSLLRAEIDFKEIVKVLMPNSFLITRKLEVYVQ